MKKVKSKSKGFLGKNYPYLLPKEKKIPAFSTILDPESVYDPKRKKSRSLQNLIDYREFIKQ